MTRHRWIAGEGPLSALAAVLLLACNCPAQAEAVGDWRPFTAEASRRFGVPIAWIERVMQVESGGRRTLGGLPIASRAGAMGLMQLMPDTWGDMRSLLGLGNDPFDPHDNILAGTLYLRLLYDRFGYPGLFGAYNAGPSRYGDYLSRRARLPDETRAYLTSLAGGPRAAPAAKATLPGDTLFAIRARAGGEPRVGLPRTSPSALFVISEGR